MNNENSAYSSDSDTDNLSILMVDDTEEGSYQNSTSYSGEELIFTMENLIESATYSVTSSTSSINHEPLSPPPHYPKASNATVMMRSSLFQNKLADPSMMLSRSLGAFEMGESFLSSHEALLGTSLPNDLSSITRNWDTKKEQTMVDDKLVGKFASKVNQESADEKIEEPSLEETLSLDEDACFDHHLLEQVDEIPPLNEESYLYEDPSTTQNSFLGTDIILIGEVPIIGNTYTSDNMFVKGVPEPPNIEDDALAMSTYGVSHTTINDSTLNEHMMSGIPAPNFVESYQEWFNLSQNCFFKDNTEKPPKKTGPTKPKKQVSYKVYKKAVVLKIVGLSSTTSFKNLQRHFYDPFILNIRYLRPLHTAYITFRNYMSMMNSILKLDGTYLDDMMISCIPSTTKEMNYDSEISANYKPESYSENAFGGYVNLKNDTVMPFVYPYMNIQGPPCYERYFIIKPRIMREVIFSSRQNYWHVNKRNADYLNRLFENTESVYFIYSVTGSKSLQGYARMKSNVINIRSSTMNELDGTPFSNNRDFKFGAAGRVWQYVFRVEWLMHGYISLNSLSNLRNTWGNNSPVNTSTDFTQLDPEVGRFILEKFHI